MFKRRGTITKSDILKSTLTSHGDEPESLPSYPEFIGPVNFTFLQDFYSMTNSWWYLPIEPYCKCTVTLQKWENINKWTWWNQHNRWWKCTTITARPSCVHQTSQFCIFEHVKFHMVNAHWNILQMRVHLQYDSIVKKHHLMDMMKSTQRVMEMYNYHCPAILCSHSEH